MQCGRVYRMYIQFQSEILMNTIICTICEGW
jgi:hypothetical protein